MPLRELQNLIIGKNLGHYQDIRQFTEEGQQAKNLKPPV
jgi:hypothetical protein